MYKKNLNSQIFGILTAIRPTNQTNGSQQQIWHCVCRCGSTTQVCTSDLIRGHTKSCGCIKESKSVQPGQKFGLLTIVQDTGEKDRFRNRLYKCTCECGKTVVVTGTKLKRNHTQSCGCLKSVSNKDNGLARQFDLTGRLFGKLRVERRTVERDHNGSTLWCRQTPY